ncbi:MAG: right-handed parallel beta-helix repeat-containing protein [Prosthecobacter sp.]|uniref:right-handed parallel beta-helix repeat-containing protein n=1 Tax=Prosthecobacter sp. TaxID=1965333 RepID=UPI0039037E54
MNHPFSLLSVSQPKKHIIIAFLLASAVALHAAGTPYSPDWANITPKRAIKHAEPDGDSLVKAVAALKPGDQLVIAAGTYSVERMWDIGVSGTAEAPIWIVAEDGAQVILTRPDDKQNVLNIGQGTPVHHLCLRGVEITGGSHGLRLGQCSEVWIDQCHIHHTGEVCLSANSANTRHLFLTRNHHHHGGGHGEGMYLGANHGQFIMSESVIALNHIHDCKGEQGDGIEVKQGSWGNLIAENDIHDTQYPCITVYGTAGKPVNIIERNLCRRSADSAMQVQGEAIVRNNVLIGGKGSGFASLDHQGKSLNLQVIHNTIINTGDAFKGSSWNAREGMILANNVLYSRDKSAMNFPKGREGATIVGNIVLGDAPKQGTTRGRGLEDFVSLSWDGEKHDATPTAEAPFDHAVLKHLLDTDFTGAKRVGSLSGAVAR